MKVARREFYRVGNGDAFRLVPIGDVHLGAAGCDEKLLADTVAGIAADPSCYWVGLGDYLDAVNRSDKRFDPLTVARWVGMPELADLPRAQAKRFLSFVQPIASKCLGLVCGNHEYTIQQKYERDVFSELVAGVKEAGGFAADYSLGLGYTGWLQLAFYHGEDRKGGSTVLKVVLHHGFSGGRLEGGKALNLQRYLLVHDCDLALMGHSHNIQIQAQDGVAINKAGQVVYTTKKGAFCGSFLGIPQQDSGDPYYERAGYLHAPVGTILVTLRPNVARQPDRVSITA